MFKCLHFGYLKLFLNPFHHFSWIIQKYFVACSETSSRLCSGLTANPSEFNLPGFHGKTVQRLGQLVKRPFSSTTHLRVIPANRSVQAWLRQLYGGLGQYILWHDESGNPTSNHSLHNSIQFTIQSGFNETVIYMTFFVISIDTILYFYSFAILTAETTDSTFTWLTFNLKNDLKKHLALYSLNNS